MNGRITGILLAAGESRRMGYPKPLLSIGKTTFLAHTAGTMLCAVDDLVVVLGAYAERIRSALPEDSRISVAENVHYADGQLSSLKVGLNAVSREASAVLVHLADHPTVKLDTYRSVIAAFAHSPERKPIVIARFDLRRGHPVLFDRSVFAELLAAPENEGARVVVNADISRVAYVDVDDAGVVLDLDSPEDLIRAGLSAPPGHSLA